MPNLFETGLFLGHLRRRWKTVAAVPAVAGALALLLSLALPKQYDATVILLIQPGAADARFPPALNAVYLEYLRSYEYVLQGDELLLRVLKEFQLDREPYGYNVDSFRRSVLDVRLFKNTKLLSLRVRFADPQKAHQIALFLAREAVRASESLRDADGDRAIRQIGREAGEARERLAKAQSELETFRRQARQDELLHTVQADLENKAEYQRELATSEVRIPELEARVATLAARFKETPEKVQLDEPVLNPAAQQLREMLDEATADLEAERAKQKAGRRALAALEVPLARHQAELAQVQIRSSEVERNYTAARDALTLLTNRANEARFSVASRTEQLQIADPGIVPQRPSSPHILFNVLLAVSLGLLAALVYENWVWNWRAEQTLSERPSARVAVP